MTGQNSDELCLSIDKEGNWFYNGSQIINRNIYLFFNKHIEKDPGGGYLLRIEGETCRLRVEDTPYVVTAVSLVQDGEADHSRFMVRLNDGTTEPLDPATLYIGEANVPYCSVKEGAFPARLLRPAYYELAVYIRQEGDDLFFVELNNKRFYLQEKKNGPPD